MSNKYKGVDITVIETKVPEDIVVRAEEVSDNGQVSGLQLKSASEWEAIVIDKNLHFSVLIEIKRSKLNKCICNCGSFKKVNFCQHVLCTLFEIRKKQEKAKDEKKTTKKRGPKAKQQPIAQLISQIDPEEMNAFVLSKARSDRSFKLLLQARFIEQIPSDHLASFIESTFPILTKANEKIAATKLKVFLDISEELTEHFKNLVSNDELTEAYNLAYLHLKKSFYIKHYLNKDHSRFYKMHKDLLSNYIEVYKLIEAPEYKQDIHTQLEELLSTSYISASFKEEKDLWMLHYRNKDYRIKLQEIVLSFLQRNNQDDYNSQYFIKMLNLILKVSDESYKEVIEKMDLQESYRIIQYLSEYKYLEACQTCLYSFYNDKQLNHPLSKMIVGVLDLPAKKKEKVVKRTALYYTFYKDEIYTSYIKEIAKNWDKAKKYITQLILEKDDTGLLVQFHLENEEYDKAIEVIKQNLSWKLIRKYDVELAEHSNSECFGIYALLLEHYLKDHFGVIAHEFVREVFNRATSIGQKNWVTELKKQLSTKFPERRTLLK